MTRWLDLLFGVPLIWIASLFLSKSSQSAAPQKILIIKLAAMGDTILLIPVLRALRKSFPNARLEWLVTNINAPVAKTVPYVDRIIVWQRRSPFEFLSLLRLLHREKYDVVIDFEQWARGSALMALATGAPTRIGFDTPGQFRSAAFNRTLPKSFNKHEISEFFDLAKLLDSIQLTQDLELWVTPEGDEQAKQSLAKLSGDKNGLLVVIHPGCGGDGLPREWPLADYALIAHWLLTHYHARVVLTSGPEEKIKTAQLNRLLGGKALDLGGALSWMGTIALLKKAQLVLSGNTGVMHAAAAFKVPQVALHGPTNPVIWGPLNPNAKVISTACPHCPCLRLGFEYHAQDGSCMKKISTEEVKSAIQSLVRQPTGDLVDRRP